MEKEVILVVDDEKEIRDLIEIYLRNEGFQVIKASDGQEALSIVQQQNVHLIILDIMMPKMDGMNFCRKVRERQEMPIIMLSAKTHDMDKVLGLSTGADDYVSKPFNPIELIARVKSQLRRYIRFARSHHHADEIVIEDMVINHKTHTVTIDGQEIKLTPREFTILELLARNRGMVFSSEQIYEKAWNDVFYQSDNTVMVHIRKIREKIEENPRKPRFIKTVWGVGYKIEK